MESSKASQSIPSLPWGRLTSIREVITWTFYSADLLREGDIFSQIFKIGGSPFRARMALDNETGLVSFYIRPLAEIPQRKGLETIINAKSFTIGKHITLGNQEVYTIFTSRKSSGGFKHFLTRALLQTHDQLLVDIECQIPSHAGSLLKPLWNSPSSADVVIVSAHPDECPVYIHKSVVLAAIPRIMELVTVQGFKKSEHAAHDSRTRMTAGSESGSSTVVDGAYEALPSSSLLEQQECSRLKRKSEDETHEAQAGARFRPNVDFYEKRSQALAMELVMPKIGNFGGGSTDDLDMQSPIRDTAIKHESSTESSAPSSSFASLSSSSSSSTLPSTHTPSSTTSSLALRALAQRPDREIWFWPAELPRRSCLDVMRWVYLQILAPTFSLPDFNPFMELLVRLGQGHHLQEFALRSQGSVYCHKDLLTLLREPELARGYAAAYLLECAKQALEDRWDQVKEKLTIDQLEHDDPTGLLNMMCRMQSSP